MQTIFDQKDFRHFGCLVVAVDVVGNITNIYVGKHIVISTHNI